MKFRVLIILICAIEVSYSQILIPKKDYVPEIRQSRYSFAFSLISNANSDPVTFGIIRQKPDSTHEIIFLTKDAFLRQASGYEVSLANPEKINFFKESHIPPTILDEMWRLKYEQFPYGENYEAGWGSNLGVPSKNQFELLKEFGIYEMPDYAYGDNFWRLLQKVNDPIWTSSYQLRK